MKYYTETKIGRKDWPSTAPPFTNNIPKAIDWCRNSASQHKYYWHYTNTRWWFEKEEDAILFALQGF